MIYDMNNSGGFGPNKYVKFLYYNIEDTSEHLLYI